ncbi:hypothetical protein [Halorientalis persicus]|uniref:hypothetical protein n=1 Tax=Halorientalis persicus TaxID=1367881 RepID=UPI001B8AA594|nr:hypothetical protein [Halorientalis persicus]
MTVGPDSIYRSEEGEPTLFASDSLDDELFLEEWRDAFKELVGGLVFEVWFPVDIRLFDLLGLEVSVAVEFENGFAVAGFVLVSEDGERLVGAREVEMADDFVQLVDLVSVDFGSI